MSLFGRSRPVFTIYASRLGPSWLPSSDNCVFKCSRRVTQNDKFYSYAAECPTPCAKFSMRSPLNNLFFCEIIALSSSAESALISTTRIHVISIFHSR